MASVDECTLDKSFGKWIKSHGITLLLMIISAVSTYTLMQRDITSMKESQAKFDGWRESHEKAQVEVVNGINDKISTLKENVIAQKFQQEANVAKIAVLSSKTDSIVTDVSDIKIKLSLIEMGQGTMLGILKDLQQRPNQK